MKGAIAQVVAELLVGWIGRAIKRRRAKRKSAAREKELLQRFTK